MPILPSGRRIEFSLDRFHTLLRQASPQEAQTLVKSLDDPDDLLFVMDAVLFGRDDGKPFFAGCLASEWADYAADWNTVDRQAFAAWLISDEARARRAEAIDYIRTFSGDGSNGAMAYPYVLVAQLSRPNVAEGSRLLQ